MKKIFFLVLNLIILVEVGFSANVINNSVGIEITDIEGPLYFQIPVCNEWIKNCHITINGNDVGELVSFGTSTFISAFKDFRQEEIPFDMYYVQGKADRKKIEFNNHDKIILRLDKQVLYDGIYSTDGNGCGFVYIRNLRLENEEDSVSAKRLETIQKCKDSLASRILERVDTSSSISLEKFVEYHQIGKNRKFAGIPDLHIEKGDFILIPKGYLCILNVEPSGTERKKYLYYVSFSISEYDECFFITTDTLLPSELMFNDHGVKRLWQDIYLKYYGKGAYLDNRDMRKVECFQFDLVSKEEFDIHERKIKNMIQDIKNNPQKYSDILYKD